MRKTVPDETRCPAWCAENPRQPHTVHRRQIHTLLLPSPPDDPAGEVARAVNVGVAGTGVGRTWCELAVTHDTRSGDLVVALTWAEAGALSQYLHDAARRFDV